MPASRLVARHPRRGRPNRLVLTMGLVALLALVAVGIVSGSPPAGVVRLSSLDAVRSGAALHLVRENLAGSTLVQLDAASAANDQPPQSLLAVSPAGDRAALADAVGEASGILTIAHQDGSQVRVQLPGLLGAGFAADGSWLAVLDGRGALWRVDAESGRAALLAEGPFLGSPIVADDGSLMLLAVSSVEAPYRSRLVRLGPASWAAVALSDDELVYAGFPLDDGGVAVVAHEPGGTLVRGVGGASGGLHTDLGPGAANVSVAPNGRMIAYESTDGIRLINTAGAAAATVHGRRRPCFSADSNSLLVRDGTVSQVLALDGSVLVATKLPAALTGAVGCLP